MSKIVEKLQGTLAHIVGKPCEMWDAAGIERELQAAVAHIETLEVKICRLTEGATDETILRIEAVLRQLALRVKAATNEDAYPQPRIERALEDALLILSLPTQTSTED